MLLETLPLLNFKDSLEVNLPAIDAIKAPESNSAEKVKILFIWLKFNVLRKLADVSYKCLIYQMINAKDIKIVLFIT